MSKETVNKGYHCAWHIHYHILFPVKYRKALIDNEVTNIIVETAEGIAHRYAIEMEAIGTDKDHIHLSCGAHPKIARTRKAPNYFAKAQVDLILYKCESYLHDLILFAVHTGLRRMELVYLQWRDINFRNWTVTVQAKDELKWQSKSGEMRVVPIPRPCHKMLLKRKARSLSEFVFANQLGKPRTNNLNRDLRNFLKDTGLYKRGTGWHTFRHTYASHLAMDGAPLNSIGELLGHKDPKMTRIYSHLSPPHLKDITDRLNFGSHKVVKMEKEAVTKSRKRDRKT